MNATSGDTTARIDEIRREIVLFIKKRFLFSIEEAELDESASLLEQGVIDSTGVLELIQFIEKTYGIEIADEELIPQNLDSIEGISRYVISKTS